MERGSGKIGSSMAVIITAVSDETLNVTAARSLKNSARFQA